MKNLYFVPFFFKENVNSGVNFERKSNKKEIYLKNCCVSLISARLLNPQDDVALVTNIEVGNTYLNLLEKNNIKIFVINYDCFTFPNTFKWSAAFFKLCALKYVVDNFKHTYLNIMYTDSDVFCQQSFGNIWDECSCGKLLLFDLCESKNNSLYRTFCKEVLAVDNGLVGISHFGGEFFASNIENASIFIDKCMSIYTTIIKNNIIFSSGDELILSISGYLLNAKNAGAYIYRFWTDSFRISTTRYLYNPVVFLHCPDQKERGFCKLFKHVNKYNKFPKNKKVYSILKLNRISLKTFIIRFLSLFIKKYRIKSYNE